MQARTKVGAASERVLVLRASRHGGVDGVHEQSPDEQVVAPQDGEDDNSHSHAQPCPLVGCAIVIGKLNCEPSPPKGTPTLIDRLYCAAVAGRAGTRATAADPPRAAHAAPMTSPAAPLPDDRAGSCSCETPDLVAAPATSADQPRDLERQRQDGDTEQRLNQARCDGRRHVDGEVEADAQRQDLDGPGEDDADEQRDRGSCAADVQYMPSAKHIRNGNPRFQITPVCV